MYKCIIGTYYMNLTYDQKYINLQVYSKAVGFLSFYNCCRIIHMSCFATMNLLYLVVVRWSSLTSKGTYTPHGGHARLLCP